MYEINMISKNKIFIFKFWKSKIHFGDITQNSDVTIMKKSVFDTAIKRCIFCLIKVTKQKRKKNDDKAVHKIINS